MILNVIKILEYKRSAINVRGQSIKSDVNKELNNMEFNVSVDEGYVDEIKENNLQDKNKKSFV